MDTGTVGFIVSWILVLVWVGVFVQMIDLVVEGYLAIRRRR